MKTTSTFAAVALVATMFVAAPAAAETWSIDAAHSAVLFRVKHVGVSYTWGRFRKLSGTINVEKKANKSSVMFEIAANSVYTNWKQRDKHLMSPDFFNAKLYPTISFKSTRVRKAGKNWNVTGELSMHGKTKKVTVRMKQVGQGKGPYGKTRTGFSGKLTIKRSDFGITKFVKEKVVSDRVELYIDLEAILQ